MQLHYFSDYQWLIDFTFCASLVFFSNEFVYGCILGTNPKVNLSILWCLLSIGFTCKSLWNITKIYFSMSDTADLMIVIMSGFSFLVFAMMILIVPEKHLSFRLDEGYRNFSDSIAKNFPHAGSSGPISLVAIKAALAVTSAFIGAVFTHSGLRFGKMYVDAVNDAGSSRARLGLLHASFLLPLPIVSLWLVPVQNALVGARLGRYALQLDDVLALRVYAAVALCLLRLALAAVHLQAYLNLADSRIRALRKEAGKISIVEFQKTVARIFHCLCLVALQYFAPVMLCWNVALLYKSLSGLSWVGASSALFQQQHEALATVAMGTAAEANASALLGEGLIPAFLGEDIHQSVAVWSVSLTSLRAVFTPLFFQGVIGYLLWFTVAAIQLTGFLGLVYHGNLSS